MPRKNPTSLKTSPSDRWIEEVHQSFFNDNQHRLSMDTISRIEDHIRHCQLHFDGLRSRSMVFVIDHASLEYLYISPNAEDVLGYSRQTMINNGFNWLFTLFSPEELSYKQDVMKDIYGALTNLPAADVYQCSSRYNVEVIHRDGSRRMMIEEMMYPKVSDEGMPLITTAFVHDMNGLMPTDLRRCRIEKHLGQESQLIFEKMYVLQQSQSPLSQRELELLKSFARGLDTIKASNIFHISPNTVKTHRKNILRKLGAQSTPEAVHIAIKNSWLQL